MFAEAHTVGAAWEVSLESEVEEWLLDLAQHDPRTADEVAAAIDKLEQDGPTLGRPLVDRIHSSKHHNMKELRPRTTGPGEIRILFAFDPERQAIVLVAGDKAGAWRQWYEINVPIADERFSRHLKAIEEGKP
ncbi:type II toxin-antitoxin system RelE/ParE family toxin [Kitasatospora sp. NBC_01539]